MRQAEIYYKNESAGFLTQNDDGSFIFEYTDLWVSGTDKPSISLTLPKRKQNYQSDYLFPFFYNMLPEGANKQSICKQMRIDRDDYFSLLTISAQYDSIGAVTVKTIK